MRKFTVIILAVMLVCMFSACSTGKNKVLSENISAEPTATAEPTAEPTATAAPALTQEMTTTSSNSINLIDILSDLSEHHHNGTAGCSLSAAKYAAQLLDYQAQKTESEDTKEIMKEFYESLDNDRLVEILDQMDSIYFASRELLEKNGKDIMETAGVVSKFYPWSEQMQKELFNDLYAGMGEKIPEEREDAGLEKELTDILTDISENYHNGTAGCSLKAAKFAGELLDWKTKRMLSSTKLTDVTQVTRQFYEALKTERALEIGEQMDSIYYAANRLVTDDGKQILEDAGYEPDYYPWTKEEMMDLFTNIYEGIKSELPEVSE